MSKGKIVLSDIHGCYLTMISLIEKCKAKYPQHDLVIAGDLIDRGPRSRDVVQYCIDNKIDVVKGNHEKMMIDSFYNENPIGKMRCERLWLSNGGMSTLAGYDTDDELLTHVKYMDSLPLYLHYPNVTFTQHDGKVRELVVTHTHIGKKHHWENRDSKDEQKRKRFEANVLWSRTENVYDIPNLYNVIGHTPNTDAKLKSCYANVDTGCVYNRDGYNKLSALIFPEMDIITQENIDE